MQIGILVLSRVVISTWNINRSCSSFDRKVVIVGRILCIISTVVFFYVAILLFAGARKSDLRCGKCCTNLFKQWLKKVRSLVYITLGCWTRREVHSCEIMERAELHDNEERVSDHTRELVMTFVALSRGLIWAPLPGGIVFVKLSEALNSPPIFVPNKSMNLDMYTPAGKRKLLFLLNLAKFVLLVYIVFNPTTVAILAVLGVIFLKLATIVIYPNPKHRLDIKRAKEIRRLAKKAKQDKEDDY
jgi:hypothetical protein